MSAAAAAAALAAAVKAESALRKKPPKPPSGRSPSAGRSPSGGRSPVIEDDARKTPTARRRTRSEQVRYWIRKSRIKILEFNSYLNVYSVTIPKMKS